MEIFRDLNKLGYKHYLDYTIEELDSLDIKSKEFSIESNLVFDWFREKHNISGEIYIFKRFWNFDIEDFKNDIQLFTTNEIVFKTYEEARLECLKKLIEIAKEQNVK